VKRKWSDPGGVEAKEAKLNNADTSKAAVQVATFNAFENAFARELSLSHFGEQKHAVEPTSKSAGAKELDKIGAKKVLLTTSFLRQVHRSLKRCARLLREQNKVRQVSADLGKSIKQIRDAQKTLRELQERIRALGIHLERRMLMGWPYLEHLDTAEKELVRVEDLLWERERTEASYIHPERRRKHDKSAPKTKYETSRFKPLLTPYDYELDSLKTKAPLQWLLESLDLTLQQCFTREHKEVTDVTRYRIISAILKSSGLDPVSSSSLKEYFADRARQKKALARNSQGS
jgi:hypothetical protein